MVGVRGGVVPEKSPSGKARFLQGEVGRPRARPGFWILLYLDSGFRGLVGGHGGDRLFRALWAIVRTWLLCGEKLGVTGGFRAKGG